MWNIPTKKELSEIPGLYENKNGKDYGAIVHMHFFVGACDWFVTEFDGEDIFYGFAILNNDLQNAEWGYVSFRELKSVKVGLSVHINGSNSKKTGCIEVDRDLYWTKRPARDVEKIMEAINY